MSKIGFVVSSILFSICETAAFQPLPLSSFPPAPTPSTVVASTVLLSSSSLDDLVEHFIQKPVSQSPMRHAVLPFTVECYDESVVFVQRATSTRLRGIEQIQQACELWDRNFVNDLAVSVSEDEERRTAIPPITIIERIARTSPTTLVVQWNTSYVPLTSQWLPTVARLWGWQLDPRPYNDQSGTIKTFSYQAIVKMFMDAIATKKLRVPLACIKGTTVCECTSSSPETIVSITEDLAYAQDLQRGVLQNRVCGQDLQNFLETARRTPGTNPDAWQEHVLNSMPWSTVPGLTDPLSIEAMNEEEAQWVPALFLGAISLFVLGFAYVLAPELIGQNLFGPRSYIVPPQDLNDIISY